MHESEESGIARFVSGLSREIQDVVELYELDLKSISTLTRSNLFGFFPIYLNWIKSRLNSLYQLD